MVWVGHVADMGEMRNVYRILFGNVESGNHSEDIGVDGKIILKWIFGEYDRKVWAGCI
jgi:hypothetical protein